MRRVGVVGQQVAHLIGVGADHGHRTDVWTQRKEIAVVFQEHQRLLGDLAGQPALPGVVE